MAALTFRSVAAMFFAAFLILLGGPLTFDRILGALIAAYIAPLPDRLETDDDDYGQAHNIFFLLFAMVVNFPIYYFISHVIYYGIIIGYLAHLFTELFTPLGVPLLYPVSKKRYTIAMILDIDKPSKEMFVRTCIWGMVFSLWLWIVAINSPPTINKTAEFFRNCHYQVQGGSVPANNMTPPLN